MARAYLTRQAQELTGKNHLGHEDNGSLNYIIWGRIHKTDQDQSKISSRSGSVENWIKLVFTKTGLSDLKFDHFFLSNMVKCNCLF